MSGTENLDQDEGNPEGAFQLERLLKAQLHIQQNLDQDLSVTAMARLAGMSESHFHRAFKRTIGETPRKYVERLRVETSLNDLYLSDLNLLQISLRYGFKNPETYSRAFRRRFAMLPSEVKRRSSSSSQGEPIEVPPIELGLRRSRESNFTVTRLNTLHVAFIRHLGRYESAPPIAASGQTLWRRLEDFVRQHHLAREPFAYLGIAQDNPDTTEEAKLRFDACILVDEPFAARGEVGHQEIAPGYYGVVRHAGPYSTLGAAYRELFERSQRLEGFKIDPSSTFELLLDTHVKTAHEVGWSELYLRLERIKP